MSESDPVADPGPTADADLYRWLGYGAFAAVAAGLLAVVSAALILGGWPAGGFGPPEVLDLVSLFVSGFVVAAYYKLSLRVAAPGLRRSALGLFGVVVIMELAGLNSTDDGARWWNIVIWIVLALATVVLIVVVWNLTEIEKDADKPAEGSEPTPTDEAAAAPPAAEQADGSSGKAGGAVIAGAVAVGLVVLKFGVKIAAIRAIAAAAGGVEMFFLAALLILTVVFFAWFAVAKIRLRGALGPYAAVTGAVELLILALAAATVVGLLADMIGAAERAGLDEKAAEAEVAVVVAVWTERTAVGLIGVSVVWAALTAGLLLSYRGRLDPDPGWADPTGDGPRD